MGTTTPAHPPLPAFDGDTVLPGRLAIALAARFPEWVRRRTTTLTFHDDKTLVQRLTVSLRVPPAAWFAHHEPDLMSDLIARPPSRVYVPLNIVTKGNLAAFRTADAEDRTVPMRNRVERCRLAVDAFSAVVDERAAGRQDYVKGSFHDAIDTIVSAPDAKSGRDAVTAELDGTDLGNLLPPGDPYRSLLRVLASGFMILVPARFEPEDHLFSVTWEESTRWTNRRTFGGVLKLFASSLGCWPKELLVSDYSIGWAQSTHFVVEEPNDAHNLHTWVEEQSTRPRNPLQPPASRLRSHEVWARPHADVSIPLKDLRDPLAGSNAKATIGLALAPRRSGAFAAVTTVAWVSFALLWVISSHLGGIDLEASTTVVVVLPAILAASLVRQGEHAIAGLLLAGIRISGLFVLLLVFAAAVFMAATDPQTRRVPTQTTICQGVPASRLAPPVNLFLSPPTPFAVDRAAGNVLCSATEGGKRLVPPHSEEVAVRVGMIGTLIVALVLSVGMVATCVRIARARAQPARRNGVSQLD